MAEWRVGHGWTAPELERRLAAASSLQRNFSIDEGLAPELGWNRHASRAVVAREAPGLPAPGGAFERAWELTRRYHFSDPRIVAAHFDPAAPLAGRRMLLEIRVLGLHFLGAVVVGAVRDESDERGTVRGFRYDTLDGHIERGCEWFLVTKDHATGEVTFTIQAAWRRGELPNLWLRAGFGLLARRYQRAWHRLAHLRLRDGLGSVELEPLPRADRLVHDAWMPLIAASPLAASDPAGAGIADEREQKARTVRTGARGQEGDQTSDLYAAFGFGIVAGARSMLAPALASQACAAPSAGRAADGVAARFLSSPRVVQLLPLAAAGELIADKLPWTPARTAPGPLLGRLGSGAIIGAAMAAREQRTAAAVAGAAGALAGTFAWYHARKLATDRGLPGWLAAVAEDALAIGLGLTLLRRAGRTSAPPQM